MIALIDGDIILHRVGYTTQEEDFYIAKYRCNELIERIILDVGAYSCRIFLSDSRENNFRTKIDPKYKLTRVQPKPKHFEELKEYVLKEWNAEIAYGMEADDTLGIAQDGTSTIICSIDKDLLMIPGFHYNFVKQKNIWVTYEEGKLAFYRSILTGDLTDNIEGLYGVGPAKAAKIIPKYESNDACVEIILQEYLKIRKQRDGQEWGYTPESAINKIRINARLLKIKESEDEELWDSPVLKRMEEQMQSSTPTKAGESSPSMEPIGQEMTSSDGFPVHGQKKESIK